GRTARPRRAPARRKHDRRYDGYGRLRGDPADGRARLWARPPGSADASREPRTCVPAVSVALRRRDAKPALETRRYDDVVAGQLVNRAVPETENGRVCAAAQDVEHVLDAGLPARGKAPQIGTSDRHCAGAEGDGLDDVAFPSRAAVQNDLDLVTHGLGDSGQDPDGRRGAVEAAAAMVGTPRPRL